MTTQQTLDAAALKKKYQEEKNKRLENGNRTSLDPVGQFHEFDQDPFAGPAPERDAICEDVDVLVTGGGMGGLLSAVFAKKYGITNIRIIEEAGDFGGAWYWNRYPGVRCDVESYIYLPFLEEVGTIPRERYSTGTEIFKHCQAVGRHFGLYENAVFQTKIISAEWNETSGRWIVKTNRGDEFRARFIAGTSGFLHYPKYPNIPGLSTFKGKMFHPSRWDYDYTGGSPEGDLVGLAGKRVALIGNGATGIQILPHLGKTAEKAYLVQRTPGAVDARNNHPTDEEWFKKQAPGWQLKRQGNFTDIIAGAPVQDEINDCWTRAAKKLFEVTSQAELENFAEVYQQHDFELMERLRSRIDDVVQDKQTADKLKPWYNLFCKRPLYSDDYLEAFNMPAVSLLDTDGRGVEAIDETGIIVNGQHYEVDCIIMASGFQIGAYGPDTATYPIIGKNGRRMADEWAKGFMSVHGLWMEGFPNFQFVGNLYQAAASFSYMHIAQEQAEHAADLFATTLRNGQDVVEVTEAAVTRWAEQMASKASGQEFFDDCTPGYYNNEGDTSQVPFYLRAYGGGVREYFSLLRSWRNGDAGDGLVFRKIAESHAKHNEAQTESA